MYQQNIFRFCAKLLLSMPKSTLRTFIDLLQDIEPFRPHIKKLDPISQEFFETQYHSQIYKGTKEQLAQRLFAVLEKETFRRMFLNEHNKVNMFDLMQNGHVVLINTSKQLLHEGASIFGKFFIALILQGIFQRARVPEDKRLPFYVYIDEAQDYASEKLIEFF